MDYQDPSGGEDEHFAFVQAGSARWLKQLHERGSRVATVVHVASSQISRTPAALGIAEIDLGVGGSSAFTVVYGDLEPLVAVRTTVEGQGEGPFALNSAYFDDDDVINKLLSKGDGSLRRASSGAARIEVDGLVDGRPVVGTEWQQVRGSDRLTRANVGDIVITVIEITQVSLLRLALVSPYDLRALPQYPIH